jgi:hypothetical protein
MVMISCFLETIPRGAPSTFAGRRMGITMTSDFGTVGAGK